MKIVDIKTKILKTPLKTPFKTALRRVDGLEELIILIYTDNNIIGYGAGSNTAILTGETIYTLKSGVEYFKPLLIGRDIEDFNSILNLIQTQIKNSTTLKSMLEMGLYDIYSKSLNLPLYKFLGGEKKEFKTDITISLNSIDKMINDSKEAVKRGYNILKIKVGEDINSDFERIRVLTEEFENISFRVDANQAWTPKETITLSKRLEKEGIYNIELIEQPVKEKDIKGLKFIRDRVNIPILADEAIFSPKDAIELLEYEACDYINIKLAKCGGVKNAMLIADIAKIYNTKCMMGCMLEGSISLTTAIHIASAKSDTITMLDLDAVNLLEYNPIKTGANFRESEILLNENLGIGVIDFKA
jgi:o-succinylbenzoate synthase